MEKRHNYVRKVAEVATQMFISNDKVTTAGLILAGSADFKTELSQSDMFDPVILLNFIARMIFQLSFAKNFFFFFEIDFTRCKTELFGVLWHILTLIFVKKLYREYNMQEFYDRDCKERSSKW